MYFEVEEKTDKGRGAIMAMYKAWSKKSPAKFVFNRMGIKMVLAKDVPCIMEYHYRVLQKHSSKNKAVKNMIYAIEMSIYKQFRDSFNCSESDIEVRPCG